MTRGALLFAATVVGCVAAWATLVPAALFGPAAPAADPAAVLPAATPDPVPARCAALEGLLPGPSPTPPAGLLADGADRWVGDVPWSAVPEVLRWVAESGAPLLSLEVDALEDSPGRARCRVVLERAP